ncbi:MAG TPA: 2-oxoacid:acceptor oxidoreductase subunit alpha [Verrucomicrobiae bacterium]|nr:2-oxoacid:acceptor oxidoreductase subunit alpha [Verrucomicrobiae bacterium]
MSESTMTTPVGGGTPKVSKISEAVIRFAGNSQDGIQAIGGFLARLAGRSEQEVMTFMTIPSTISGGPSIFQVRIGSGEVLSSGDEADLLVAFYQHSYDDHMVSVRKGGIVLYDSDHVTPNPEWEKEYRHVPVPISSRTIEAIGGTAKDKGKNIFTLGLIAKTFDLNVTKLERLIGERFGGKDTSILQNAMSAFQAGYGYSLGKILETFQFVEAQKKSGQQVVMTGNEALAYGLIAAGIRFGAAYPITPWSEVMEILRRELPKYGGTFVQCEDEIASVCMAIGAGWAGRVAVTGSSGPGVALKSEGIGWAVMAEVPLIVCDIQRGGPSTGMPTSVEQSDLNLACFGGHGDSPRVVVAPGSVEDCFYTAIEAVNIARKYNVPVFIVSDQSIATRIEAFPEPALEKVCQDLTPDLAPVADYTPYPLSGEIQPRVAPGTQILTGKYPIATGLEHDEMGHPTGSPKLHMQMTARRRKKLQKLATELPVPQVYGPPEGNVLLVGWGSTQGPIREAVERARAAGDSVSGLHLRHISPLPPGLEEIFAGFNDVVVVEMNDEGLYGYGQLGGLLRARYCNAKIRGLNKTDGLTWRVREILDRVKSNVAAGLRKL